MRERGRSELRVCALYPELMNIYADRGNLLMLEQRCRWRGIDFRLSPSTLEAPLRDEHDIYYIGGGQDSDQRLCAADLVARKAPALRAAAARHEHAHAGFVAAVLILVYFYIFYKKKNIP